MEKAQYIQEISDIGRAALLEQAEENADRDVLRMGYELEYIFGNDQLRPFRSSFYHDVLDHLAAREDTDPVIEDTLPGAPVIGVQFNDRFSPIYGSETSPGFDFDYGPEGEVQTEIVTSIEDGIRQVDAIEGALGDALVDDGRLYRQGLTAGLMVDDLDDAIDWDVDPADDLSHLKEYEMTKRRYAGLERYYTLTNMVLGGTGSIQVTANPFADLDRDYETFDDAFAMFMGGDSERPGIPALSPVLFAPFMNSPRIADSDLVTRYAREDAYEMGRTNSPIITADQGREKFGYSERFADVDGVDDIVAWNIEQPTELLPVPINALELVDHNGDAPSEVDAYDYLEDVADDGGTIAVVPLRDDESAIRFEEIVEDEYVEGVLQLQTPDGGWAEERVEADLSAEQLVEMYDAIEGTNVPNYRPGLFTGAVESRDFCNNPYWKETITMQAATFNAWEQLQDVAADYGITDDDAADLRTGLPADGLDYELPNGQPVTALLEDMQPVLAEAAFDASLSPDPAIALNDYLQDVTDTGKTPADRVYDAYTDDAFAAAYQGEMIGRHRVLPEA